MGRLVKLLIFLFFFIQVSLSAHAQYERGSGFNEGDLNMQKYSVQFDEVDQTPSVPPCTELKVYNKDKSGLATLTTLDCLGNETQMPSGGASPVTGTFTSGYVPVANGTSSLTNTSTPIFESGTNIGIGTTSPVYTLDVISSGVASRFLRRAATNSLIPTIIGCDRGDGVAGETGDNCSLWITNNDGNGTGGLFGSIKSIIDDPSSISKDSSLVFQTYKANTLTDALFIKGDYVGIGTTAPAVKFAVIESGTNAQTSYFSLGSTPTPNLISLVIDVDNDNTGTVGNDGVDISTTGNVATGYNRALNLTANSNDTWNIGAQANVQDASSARNTGFRCIVTSGGINRCLEGIGDLYLDGAGYFSGKVGVGISTDLISQLSVLNDIFVTGASGSTLSLFFNDITPTADDQIAQIVYQGFDSIATSQDYTRIRSNIKSPTSGTEYGSLTLATVNEGTFSDNITFVDFGAFGVSDIIGALVNVTNKNYTISGMNETQDSNSKYLAIIGAEGGESTSGAGYDGGELYLYGGDGSAASSGDTNGGNGADAFLSGGEGGAGSGAGVTGNTGNVILSGGGGNVGIGITAPTSNFHVVTTNTSGTGIFNDCSSVTTGYCNQIKMSSNSSVGQGLHIDLNGATGGDGLLITDSAGTSSYAGDMMAINTPTSGAVNPSGLMINGGRGSSYQLNVQSGAMTGDLVKLDCDTCSTVLNVSGGEMVIKDSGFIGIGVTAPVDPLHVYHATDNELLTLESGDQFAGIVLKDNVDLARIYGNNGGFLLQTGNGAGGFTSPMVIEANTAANTLYMDNVSSNVGIGTASPGSKLTVVDGTVNTSTFMNLNNTSNDQFLKMGINVNDGEIGVDNGDAIAIGHWDNIADTTITSRIYITSSGNVGIGTTAPANTLHVNGEIVIPNNASYNSFDSTGTQRIVAALDSNDDYLFGFTTSPAGTTTEIRFRPGSTEKMTILEGGNVGIGTSAPGSALSVVGQVTISNLAAVGTDPMCWDGSGASLIGDCTSNAAYKENVSNMSIGLNEVMQLRPVEFDWVGNPKHTKDIGLIAEEVELVSPLLVTYRKDIVKDAEGNDVEGANYHLGGVKYMQMTSVLIKAIQELKEENDKLKSRLDKAGIL